jgi:hypothetical protein
MAGRGPAPKPKDQRRRTNAPTRGEWVDLPAVATPTLPELPKRPRGAGRWHPRTVAAWEAWRQDPASTQYGSAEVSAALELAWLHHESIMDGEPKASEIRLRMDGLGLTAKGKRDLRWRAPTEHAAEEVKPERERSAEVRQLRAV